ncbi:pyrimidine reductase family protein [Nakamurella sp. GG22]
MLPETPTPDDVPDLGIDRNSGPAVGELPSGPGADDELAALYAWPPLPDPVSGGTSADPWKASPRVVRANMIASLDGGATLNGRSGGLGNPADEHLFALLRDLADVILVGAGTVRAEGYGGIRLPSERAARRLRWGFGAEPPPIAVVTGRGLDPGSPLFVDTRTPPIVITTEQGADTVPAGVRVIVAGTDRIDPAVAIDALAGLGLRRIHCEGGPALLAALAAGGLLDEYCLTIAPLMLGSRAAPVLPIELQDPLGWELVTAAVSGNHLFTRYRKIPR